MSGSVGWAPAAALGFSLFARSFEDALWLYGLVGFTQGGSVHARDHAGRAALAAGASGAGVGWVLAGMSAGYVGSISLAQGLIASFDYGAAFVVSALGTVIGAIFGTVAAARVANRIAGPQARMPQGACSRTGARGS